MLHNGFPLTPRRLTAPLIRVSQFTVATEGAADLVREAVEAGLIKPAPPKPKCKSKPPPRPVRPVETRVCKCGAQFQTRSATQKWCEIKCLKRMQARRKLVWAVPKPCDTCGREFTPRRPWGKRCMRCSAYIEKPPPHETRLP